MARRRQLNDVSDERWKQLIGSDSGTGDIMFKYRKGDDTYPCFSNFFPARIIWLSTSYESTEHAYQAAKTLDGKWWARIRNAPNAGAAKRLGGQCPLRPNWDTLKIPTTEQILRCKFAQHKDLYLVLASTGDRKLCEWAPWDSFWGLGKDGNGKNWLGRLLMKIRADILRRGAE